MTAVVLQDWEVHARFAQLCSARGRNRNFGAVQTVQRDAGTIMDKSSETVQPGTGKIRIQSANRSQVQTQPVCASEILEIAESPENRRQKCPAYAHEPSAETRRFFQPRNANAG